MKHSNLLPVFIFICMLGLFGCTHDESMTEQAVNFTIKVQAQAVTPQAGIRIPVEEGYKTVFKGGEQIGITAIKNGSIYNGMNNIPFTYDATTDSWTPSNNTLPQLYYYSGLTYIAYYPYDAAMSNKKSEQEIVDAFTPQTDQSTYASYTASDLMTATGTTTGSSGAYTISFDLKHRMAMVEVSIHTTYFTTSITDGYDYSSIIDYPVKNINKGIFKIDEAEYSSCAMGNGAFRVLFKPEQTARSVQFDFQLAEGQQSYVYTDPTTRQIDEGKYYLYSIVTPKSTPAIRQVCPGDFYYNTGNILPYDAIENGVEIPFKTDCIGIVFHVGAGPSDELSYYAGSGLERANAIHGYVTALQDAGSGTWGPRGSVAPMPQIERDSDGGTEAASYRGYKNTTAVLNGDYPVFKNAKQYNTTVPAPDNSSDWYLPTIQQMRDIYSLYKNATGNIIYDSMQKAGGTVFSGIYWTASQAYSLCAYNIQMENGAVNSTRGKNNGANSRAILTF